MDNYQLFIINYQLSAIAFFLYREEAIAFSWLSKEEEIAFLQNHQTAIAKKYVTKNRDHLPKT
jgi:hypothetical protein